MCIDHVYHEVGKQGQGVGAISIFAQILSFCFSVDMLDIGVRWCAYHVSYELGEQGQGVGAIPHTYRYVRPAHHAVLLGASVWGVAGSAKHLGRLPLCRLVNWAAYTGTGACARAVACSMDWLGEQEWDGWERQAGQGRGATGRPRPAWHLLCSYCYSGVVICTFAHVSSLCFTVRA